MTTLDPPRRFDPSWKSPDDLERDRRELALCRAHVAGEGYVEDWDPHACSYHPACCRFPKSCSAPIIPFRLDLDHPDRAS